MGAALAMANGWLHESFFEQATRGESVLDVPAAPAGRALMPSAQPGPPPESSAESSAEPAQHVSVILPVHNGEAWLDSCLGSLLRQSVLGQPSVRLQLSAFDDGSSDGTWAALQRWHTCELAAS